MLSFRGIRWTQTLRNDPMKVPKPKAMRMSSVMEIVKGAPHHGPAKDESAADSPDRDAATDFQIVIR
jgi:hypothetical protein